MRLVDCGMFRTDHRHWLDLHVFELCEDQHLVLQLLTILQSNGEQDQGFA